MANEHPTNGHQGDRDSSGWVILGVVLIVAGFFLGARNLGIVPWPLGYVWDMIMKARVGLGIVLIGIVLIWWAQSGRGFRTPARGAKLYRSRQEKWLAGVLGGLAEYFGMDVTMLRLAFIALVVLFDVGGLVLAYIIMAIVVPYPPAVPQAPPQSPEWPSAGAPPAAPAPPAADTAPGEADGTR